MSNKARNDKGSILIDVENLLDVFEPCFMRMPKIRRIHGAAVRMEDAAYDLINYYHIAYEMTGPDEVCEKRHYITQMIGAYGRMQSCFKRLMKVDIDTQKRSTPENKGEMSLFSDTAKLAIAQSMERIEEGVRKWRSSVKLSRIVSTGRSAPQEARGSVSEFRE